MPAPNTTTSHAETHRALDTIIIGAGPAGISAARTLSSLAPNASVVLLEARGRIGGRTLTSTALGVPVDLGASWIHHYGSANPVVPLAQRVLSERLGVATRTVDEDSKEAHDGVKSLGAEAWEKEGVPVLTTACYCGLVDAVDEDGKAMRVPSPFPGLGGGEGRFVPLRPRRPAHP